MAIIQGLQNLPTTRKSDEECINFALSGNLRIKKTETAAFSGHRETRRQSPEKIIENDIPSANLIKTKRQVTQKQTMTNRTTERYSVKPGRIRTVGNGN